MECVEKRSTVDEIETMMYSNEQKFPSSISNVFNTEYRFPAIYTYKMLGAALDNFWDIKYLLLYNYQSNLVTVKQSREW